MITPHSEHPSIASTLGIPRFFIKREDLHPYGSHKGRSIPVMIDTYTKKGMYDFALSSSGNAALAALRHIQACNSLGLGHPLSLSILVGEHINPEKKTLLTKELTDPRITLTETARPLQTLLSLIKGESRQSLRQSTDDTALIGYTALAEELLAIPDLSDVYVGTSSGTTAQALIGAFKSRNRAISVHIVQTTTCHPLAESFDTTTGESVESSHADAIVDRVAHRKATLTALLTETNGDGLIVTNTEIADAQTLLKQHADIQATANGALGVAGLMKARAQGAHYTGSVACILCGI